MIASRLPAGVGASLIQIGAGRSLLSLTTASRHPRRMRASAQYYRDQAKRIRALAEQYSSFVDIKDQLLAIAGQFDRLAQRALRSR
jgi:hypothetical protein